MIRNFDRPFLDRDDPSARRFWALLVSITSGLAAQSGVPVRTLTGSAVLRDPCPLARRSLPET